MTLKSMRLVLRDTHFSLEPIATREITSRADIHRTADYIMMAFGGWVLIVALGFVLLTTIALLWSIARPNQRLWPPRHYVWFTPILVWVPTVAIFGALVWLSCAEWNNLDFPAALRWGAGVPLIVISNIAVWSEVAQFGLRQTGGAEGSLKTSGLYRHSRNPQYVADSMMILGWVFLSASPSVLVIGLGAITALLIAPFAEEPWLAEKYGEAWKDYTARVRRYL